MLKGLAFGFLLIFVLDSSFSIRAILDVIFDTNLRSKPIELWHIAVWSALFFLADIANKVGKD